MADLADQNYAARIVSYLLSSFPQQAPDPEIYSSQLTTLCIGRPVELLRRMVNPIDGLLGKAEFLPSIATVKEWLDTRSPKPAPVKKLEPPDPPPPSPEERARVEETWRRARRQFQAAAIAMQSGFRKERRPSTVLTKEQQDALDRYIANPETP